MNEHEIDEKELNRPMVTKNPHCPVCFSPGSHYSRMHVGWPGPPPGELTVVDCENCGGFYKISRDVPFVLSNRQPMPLYKEDWREMIHLWLKDQSRPGKKVPIVRYKDFQIVMYRHDGSRGMSLDVEITLTEIQLALRELQGIVKCLQETITNGNQ